MKKSKREKDEITAQDSIVSNSPILKRTNTLPLNFKSLNVKVENIKIDQNTESSEDLSSSSNGSILSQIRKKNLDMQKIHSSKFTFNP